MKSNLLNLGVLMTGVLLVISCKSNAQSKEDKKERERPSIEEIFEMMDENKDGKLTKNEVKGPLLKDFVKIDTDEDGFITKDELKKAPKPDRKGPPRKEQ